MGLLGEVEPAWSRSERGDGIVTVGERRCMAREVVAAFQGVGDACLSPVQPEGTARGQTVGARGRFGLGARRVAGQVAPAAYGAVVTA